MQNQNSHILTDLNTTSSKDYSEWQWFKDYLVHVEKHKVDGAPKNTTFYSNTVPVEIAINYADWAIKTPEIRDIIYRLFFLEDDSRREDSVMSTFSILFFQHEKNIAGAGIALSKTWKPITKILSGETKSARAPDFRESLLKLSTVFHR